MIERPIDEPGDEGPRSAIGARIDAQPSPEQPPNHDPSPRDPFEASQQPAYAGFWRRLAAYLVDSFIVAIPTILLIESIGLTAPDPAAMLEAPLEELAVLLAAVYLAQWPYFAGFEASSWQATPGKRLVRVKVTDVHGHRLGFAHATGRYFAKLISEALLAIGYLMIAFTAKKQGLHDLIAQSLVLER